MTLSASLLACVGARAATPPVSIPSFAFPAPPAYEGAPAVADPIRGTGRTPQNPFMAANGLSQIHDDGWQSDAHTWGGPLGRSPQTLSSLLNRDCATITFDRQGRLVSICIGASGPQLYMLDPTTLATLATFALPPRQDVSGNPFQDYTGGGYVYLDNHERVVTSTTTKHIYVIAETPGAPGFQLVRDYDLSDQNDGVYIATNRKLYRFTAGRGDVPRITWQITYPNNYQHKPGQVDDGTGTTPTVLPGGYVNITDNADPMDVMVYRTAVRPTRLERRHGRVRRVRLPREVCRVPVFSRGSSADENSLIAMARSMIAENNYGYSTPADVTDGKVTAAGFARVDINPGGTGCHLVWTSSSERTPTAVSKLSLANGLIYTYTKDPGSSDPWYWTAIDFRTGRTGFKVLAGTGSLGYNNNYAGIAIAPTGTAYLGVLGGIVAMRDGS